jgi:MFS family permease
MTTVCITAGPLSEVEHSRQLRRALIASTVGTTIEWYDFLLYGQVTGLVFGKLFFPQSDPLVGVLQAFAVFFVGFLGRPIGAAIFGHWGDRIGRKATLIATLLVTGLATMAVGLVPTYESIGIWGAVLLVIIRLIQGIGVGGEWGGSVLLAMEWARTNKNRGLLAAWPQVLARAAFALAVFGEDINVAIGLIDRSLTLNPSFALGWHWSGVLRNFAGQPDLAIVHFETSARLSPRDRIGGLLATGCGAAHFLNRRFDDAAAILLSSLEHAPGFAVTYRLLASCYAHMGRLEDARGVIERLRAITPVVVPSVIP